jgi:hypothetical protein
MSCLRQPCLWNPKNWSLHRVQGLCKALKSRVPPPLSCPNVRECRLCSHLHIRAWYSTPNVESPLGNFYSPVGIPTRESTIPKGNAHWGAYTPLSSKESPLGSANSQVGSPHWRVYTPQRGLLTGKCTLPNGDFAVGSVHSPGWTPHW